MTVETQPVSAPSEIVSSLRGFVAEHGGSAKAVIQPVGYVGVRITVVAEDGVLGDRVVADLPTAHAVVAALPNVTESDWDREVTSIVTPRRGHWQKMAGWVAKQTRFPKARNER